MKAILAIAAIGAMGWQTTPALAQRAPAARFAASQDTTRVIRDGWSVMRAAKWTTALASSGIVAYGFIQNRQADRDYEAIELLCEEDESACATKPDSDEYADAALEARYNEVLKRDNRAELALVVGQVGLAASLLLFILDLPENTGSDDIPYDPQALRIGMHAGRIQLGMHLPQ